MFHHSRSGFFNVFLFTALAFNCHYATAQSDTVKLRIIITDSYTKRGVQGASLVDRTSGIIAATTDVNGYIETRVNRNNQLYIFATGYHALPVSLADSAMKPSYFLRLVIEPFTMGLSQSVIIKGSKSIDKIGEDRQNLGKTPEELKKPKIPFYNPLDLLFDKVSARGKEREKLKKTMVSDDKWKVMTELLNYCNERKLITLPEDNYNDFINYCDMSIGYLQSHSDYEIISAISAKFELYAKQKGLK